MPPPRYRSHVHSGCRVSRKPVASTSLLLWLFVTVLPLVQAGARPQDLASSIVRQLHKQVSKELPGAFGAGSERAVLLVSTEKAFGESQEISTTWLLKALEPINDARHAVSAPLAVAYLHLPCHLTHSGFGFFFP